ncbi:uncharacterized protein LOC124284982 isoform X2 [Haliotis rubra]|uniref:uncharacterized protein LOC124284982 isoform X2 n=1 Tax=Haliotis rubra TaxID=36100 RepID=UPI001EE5B776|nr:uncharacterized protein LOC124284982 isoform X2 [Haliotis rubra]
MEELLVVQYGHGDSDEVEELKRSLEEKDNIIKEKEEIIKEKEQLIKDKDEELFAMQANLARLQPKTIQACPCNGALASSLRCSLRLKWDVVGFIKHGCHRLPPSQYIQ